MDNIYNTDGMTSPSDKKKYIDWKKFNNPLAPPTNQQLSSSPQIETVKSIDYLKDQRIKREEEIKQGYKRSGVDKVWDKVVTN